MEPLDSLCHRLLARGLRMHGEGEASNLGAGNILHWLHDSTLLFTEVLMMLVRPFALHNMFRYNLTGRLLMDHASCIFWQHQKLHDGLAGQQWSHPYLLTSFFSILSGMFNSWQTIWCLPLLTLQPQLRRQTARLQHCSTHQHASHK